MGTAGSVKGSVLAHEPAVAGDIGGEMAASRRSTRLRSPMSPRSRARTVCAARRRTSTKDRDDRRATASTNSCDYRCGLIAHQGRGTKRRVLTTRPRLLTNRDLRHRSHRQQHPIPDRPSPKPAIEPDIHDEVGLYWHDSLPAIA